MTFEDLVFSLLIMALLVRFIHRADRGSL